MVTQIVVKCQDNMCTYQSMSTLLSSVAISKLLITSDQLKPPSSQNTADFQAVERGVFGHML